MIKNADIFTQEWQKGSVLYRVKDDRAHNTKTYSMMYYDEDAGNLSYTQIEREDGSRCVILDSHSDATIYEIPREGDATRTWHKKAWPSGEFLNEGVIYSCSRDAAARDIAFHLHELADPDNYGAEVGFITDEHFPVPVDEDVRGPAIDVLKVNDVAGLRFDKDYMMSSLTMLNEQEKNADSILVTCEDAKKANAGEWYMNLRDHFVAKSEAFDITEYINKGKQEANPDIKERTLN